MPIITESDLQPDDLEDWLHQRDIFEVPVDSSGQKAIGLRLLIQQWGQAEKFSTSTFGMPCTRQTLDDIIKCLSLPSSYPHDLARCRYIPTQFQQVATSTGTNMGL